MICCIRFGCIGSMVIGCQPSCYFAYVLCGAVYLRQARIPIGTRYGIGVSKRSQSVKIQAWVLSPYGRFLCGLRWRGRKIFQSFSEEIFLDPRKTTTAKITPTPPLVLGDKYIFVPRALLQGRDRISRCFSSSQYIWIHISCTTRIGEFSGIGSRTNGSETIFCTVSLRGGVKSERSLSTFCAICCSPCVFFLYT